MLVNVFGEKKFYVYKIFLFFKFFLGYDSYYSRYLFRKNVSDFE